jgi:hypothetical protein
MSLAHQGNAMNCFISYTQADLSWAEWIALIGLFLKDPIPEDIRALFPIPALRRRP